jgi:hypothetical protein
VQALGELHDTPDRELSLAPAGLGVFCRAQLVPFQVSANVPSPACPTAVQALGELHDTPDSSPLLGLAGLGVFCRAQVVPFQVSANVRLPPSNVV